jgi:hypothetical protein
MKDFEMYKSVISPQQSSASKLTFFLITIEALHKKASTTTQSKLAEYIKGASKGKGVKAVSGYGTTMKVLGGSIHGN